MQEDLNNIIIGGMRFDDIFKISYALRIVYPDNYKEIMKKLYELI